MRKIIYWVYLIFTILLPLFFLTSTSELFEFPKFLLLLASSGIILIFYLFEGIKYKNWSLNYRNPLGYAILAVLATQILATIFSIHPYTSFWGYYSRFHQGLLTTICYTILYFGALKYLDLQAVQKILKSMVKVSLVVALLAILEHFDFSFTCPFINQSFSDSCWKETTNPLYRSFATLGQPNWLAAYLIPNIFLLFYLYFADKKQKNTYSNIQYSIFYILLLTALLFTKSRSGYLAFGFGTLTYFYIFVRQNNLDKIKSLALKWLAVTAAVAAFYLFPSYWQKASTNNVSPEVNSGSGALTEISTSSADIRKIVWTGALKLLKERPILGYGPETFAYTYYQVRGVEHNYTTEWDFLYNKAHNEYLNFAATSGLIGLAAYLYYHFVVLKMANTKVGSSKKTNKEFELFQKSYLPAVGGSLISFAVTNFFGFSIIPVYAFMMLFSAFLIEGDNQQEKDSPLVNLKIVSVLTATIALYLIIMPLRLYFADHYYTLGKSLSGSQKLEAATEMVKTAVILRPSEDLYTTYLADLYAQLGQKDLALYELNKSRAKNNLHQNFLKSRARSYVSLAGVDPIYYQNAISELEYALKLAPTDPKLAYNLGLIYSRIAKPIEAVSYMKKAIELKKDYYEPYYALTLLYESTKSEKLVPDLLKEAKVNLKTIPQPLQLKIDKYLGV